MLPDTNRHEHWHSAFRNFTCPSIFDSLRSICALKIHFATRRQNTIPIFARNSIRVTLCMFGESVLALIPDHEVRDRWISRRETVEARGTKWNFDVEADSGIPGPTLEPRRDEGMPTGAAPMEIPTVPPPAPTPEEHVPEMRAFRSEFGRTPGCPACETPGPEVTHS